MRSALTSSAPSPGTEAQQLPGVPSLGGSAFQKKRVEEKKSSCSPVRKLGGAGPQVWPQMGIWKRNDIHSHRGAGTAAGLESLRPGCPSPELFLDGLWVWPGTSRRQGRGICSLPSAQLHSQNVDVGHEFALCSLLFLLPHLPTLFHIACYSFSCVSIFRWLCPTWLLSASMFIQYIPILLFSSWRITSFSFIPDTKFLRETFPCRCQLPTISFPFYRNLGAGSRLRSQVTGKKSCRRSCLNHFS